MTRIIILTLTNPLQSIWFYSTISKAKIKNLKKKKRKINETKQNKSLFFLPLNICYVDTLKKSTLIHFYGSIHWFAARKSLKGFNKGREWPQKRVSMKSPSFNVMGALMRHADRTLSTSINLRGNYTAMSTNVNTKLQRWWFDERPADLFFFLLAKLYFFVSKFECRDHWMKIMS